MVSKKCRVARDAHSHFGVAHQRSSLTLPCCFHGAGIMETKLRWMLAAEKRILTILLAIAVLALTSAAQATTISIGLAFDLGSFVYFSGGPGVSTFGISNMGIGAFNVNNVERGGGARSARAGSAQEQFDQRLLDRWQSSPRHRGVGDRSDRTAWAAGAIH